MAGPKKRKNNKRNKGKIKIRKSVRLVHKNDATRVANDGDTIPKAPARLYRDTGANFKIKIKRK
jgi:hypothetical protein